MSFFFLVLFFQTQDYDTWLQEFKEKTVDVLKQHTVTTEAPVSEGAGKWRDEGVPEGHLFLFLTSLSIPSLSFQDSALKLKEAEEAQSTLQAECEQYRAILAETVSCSPWCCRWSSTRNTV